MEKKKPKKDIKIQIVVHCPSEHPLCKTAYGKSHGYKKPWSEFNLTIRIKPY